MSTRTVTTQAELDTALAAKVDYIEIRSERGVWLEVRAYGSATVTAYGSATVRAYGSATVRATDSATVRAYGSATVRAYGSATVRAYDSATVRATSHVAVHLHHATVKATGGVQISHHLVDLADAEVWCEYHGVTVEDGVAQLYKAVDEKWTTPRNFGYSPGATPTAPDWSADGECGGGLHFGPTPTHALDYHFEATRFVRVGVAVETLCPILGGTAKAKAPAVVTPCVEVDVHGDAVEAVKA
jgi:hypothetical protein